MMVSVYVGGGDLVRIAQRDSDGGSREMLLNKDEALSLAQQLHEAITRLYQNEAIALGDKILPPTYEQKNYDPDDIPRQIGRARHKIGEKTPMDRLIEDAIAKRDGHV